MTAYRPDYSTTLGLQCEMWCFRRLSRILWTQAKTNEWVLHELNEKRQLLQNIKRRKTGHCTHVMRTKSTLQKNSTQGYISKRKSVEGKIRRSWNITKWTGLKIKTD